jgi:EmrB/QacA subfamily drug resistance transporter
MENLDGTVIVTALPAMARSFGESPVRLSLGVTAYMLSLAVFIPISGWVADRFGSRTVFRLAIVIFTLGSVLCGVSTGLTGLAVARVVQGIGGAMMVPVGRLILMRSVEKAELVRAMTYLTVPALIGPVVGPVVGGFIATYLSWPWIFLLNVPIGVLGVVLVTLYIEDVREPGMPPLDWRGFILTGLSLSGLMYGFELISRDTGNTAVALGLMAGGLSIGVLAVRHANRHIHPLVDLSLFRIPTFSETVWGGILFRLAMGGLPFLLPLLFQLGFGMTAFASGMLTFIAAIGALTMKVTAQPILRRFGFRASLIANSIIGSASIVVCCAFTASTPSWLIMSLLLVGGFSRSLQFTSLNTLAFADIEPAKLSAATSLASMQQQMALGLGVAVSALLLHLALVERGAAGQTPGEADIKLSLLIIGLLPLTSIWFFRRLVPAAGAEISGHRDGVVIPPPSSGALTK